CEISSPSMSALGQQRQGQLARCGGLCPLYSQKRTWIGATGDVRFVPKAADMIGTVWRPMSALPPKADITAGLSGKSALCQKRTYASQQFFTLFDHLALERG